MEPPIEDDKQRELLRVHYDKTTNTLIQHSQSYDHLSAVIIRKIRSPKTNRYNWKAGNTSVDFDKLAEEIKEADNKSVWKLYVYLQEPSLRSAQ